MMHTQHPTPIAPPPIPIRYALIAAPIAPHPIRYAVIGIGGEVGEDGAFEEGGAAGAVGAVEPEVEGTIHLGT
jgi:hypothetical protein